MDDAGRRSLRIGLALLGLIALAVAYRDLLTLGPRYGVESGFEYWLFVPNDRAPAVVLLLSAWLAWRRWPRLGSCCRYGRIRQLTPLSTTCWIVTTPAL